MRHVNARLAKIPCKNQPKKSVKASLLQCKLDHCVSSLKIDDDDDVASIVVFII